MAAALAATAELLRQLRERQNRPQRVYRDRSNPFEELSEKQFRTRYRMYKHTAIELIDMMAPDLQRDTERGHALPPYLQVLTALRYYATGSFQSVVGDLYGIDQGTVSRVVCDVSPLIARRRGQFIQFISDQQDLQQRQLDFFNYCNFPGVLGAIDCTHVPIQSPGGPNALYFMNRKRRYSINTQIVCDMEGRILNIVARWPGSAHDSRIFNESSLKAELERGQIEGHLLGDSGYPCLRYLMTPLLAPANAADERYNKAQIRGRNVIERLNGMLKRRFPCLNHMRIKLDTVFAVIIACATLFNFLLVRRDPAIPTKLPEQIPGNVRPLRNLRQTGNLKRQQLIREHFGN
ncbi:putative nuclease HARBI1 [Amphiura filiformis]|uniref:putative nuclease HARBI1 n=1 Tax=Amphiura filiformis TaxID=82378 RepID=UPI003B20CBDF